MYTVYVIELSRKVFSENHKFRQMNPQYNGRLQCLYVGMSSKSPKVRFIQHKTRYKSQKGISISSTIVERYGLYLRPTLYHHLKPFKSLKQALTQEKKLAIELRRKGYAVWSN